MKYYSAYLLTQTSRDRILQVFKPIYSKVICHHITQQFDVPKDATPPDIPSSVEIVGHIDSGDGVEGLLVAIDGSTIRPDGKSFYHITLSLASGRKAVETNNYTKAASAVSPMAIMVIPKILP